MAGKNRSVWLGGTSAMLVMAGFAVPVPGAASSPADFTPPEAQLLLTRTLHRPLPGGQAIITTRHYAVRIVRVGTGYRVEGSLIDAKAEAPPLVAGIAELERKRVDEGLFPIMLDENGLIAGSGALRSDGSLDRGAMIATQTLSGSDLPVRDRMEAQAFVDQLRGRAARSQWPSDIFRPQPGKRSESRVIQLPGGDEGSVTIEIVGRGPGQDGQLAELDRVVTTDLAGDKRVTREHWQLRRGTLADSR
jgi:hypothetical protein